MIVLQSTALAQESYIRRSVGSFTSMTDHEDQQEHSQLSSGGYARRRLVAALTPLSHLQQVPYSVPATPFRVTTSDAVTIK